MKFLLKSPVTPTIQATVELLDPKPNSPSEIVYEGDQYLVEEIKQKIDRAYGAFGHLMSADSATAIDFQHVMTAQMKQFSPELIAGKLLEVYDPEIPEGAVT